MTHTQKFITLLTPLKVNHFRNSMLPEFKVALWDFEFALIKRTILRHKGVRGLVFLVSISTSTGKYIRSLDLESMVGVSLEHASCNCQNGNAAYFAYLTVFGAYIGVFGVNEGNQIETAICQSCA